MLRLSIAKYKRESVSAIESEILLELNPYESKRIREYTFKNKEHRIIGFHLLKNQLNYFKEPFSLFELQRNSFHKPYFNNTSFDFSISHSNNYVVCLASESEKVGVDIEFEEQELINMDSDFFCSSEKESVRQQKGREFYYYLHTRKEAFSKAIGQGIFLEHKLFDVQNESIFFNNDEWFLNSLNLLRDYSLSYASNKKKSFFEIIDIEIW